MTIGTPSPRRRGKGGPMARALTMHAAENALTVNNMGFNTRGVIWSKMDRIPKHPLKSERLSRRRYVESMVGQVEPVGEGKSGATFVISVTPAVLGALKQLFENTLSHVAMNKMPKVGSLVVMKVVNLRGFPSLKEAVGYSIRETKAHLHLCKHVPINIGTNSPCPHTVHPYQHVPCLYAAGIDLNYGMAVTCMQFVAGVPISQVPITAKLFHETQRAFCSVWLSGMTHNDAHFENILVTLTGKVYLIDFEFCSHIPASTQRRFTRFLDHPGSAMELDTAAEILFARHTNAVQFQRTHGAMTFYNPEYKALRVLWTKMSRQEQQKFDVLYGEKSVSCALRKS